jgi:hypothetical protein
LVQPTLSAGKKSAKMQVPQATSQRIFGIIGSFLKAFQDS